MNESKIQSKNLEYMELTGDIIKCAINVHKNLGSGFDKSIYLSSLSIELFKFGFNVELGKMVKILYKNEEVGSHNLDLVINKTILIGLLKVENFKKSHVKGMLTLLQAAEKKVGLLFSFSNPLLKIKRVYHNLD
jgi:GxxExxY protein